MDQRQLKFRECAILIIDFGALAVGYIKKKKISFKTYFCSKATNFKDFVHKKTLENVVSVVLNSASL